MMSIFSRFSLFLVTLFWAGSVVAMPITNGNFEAGLDGWYDASGNGSVSSVDGHALLSTGPGSDFQSAVLVQGDDGWFSFENPVVLPEDTLSINFDAWIYSIKEDSMETGDSVFSDSFSLSVYDSDDYSLDQYFEDIPLDWSQQQYSYDISGLAGRSVAFSFELIDWNDGFDLSVGLDNIFFDTKGAVMVSEPSSLVLIALGVFALLRVRARQ